MAKTPAEVQRDVEKLRQETDALITELQLRMREATNLSTQVRRHPAAAAGVGLALAGGLTLAGFAVYGRVKAERKPPARLKRQVAGAKEVFSEKDKKMNENVTYRAEQRKGNELLKRVLYAAMMAAAAALASYLARRMVETVWTKTMQELPPGEGY